MAFCLDSRKFGLLEWTPVGLQGVRLMHVCARLRCFGKSQHCGSYLTTLNTLVLFERTQHKRPQQPSEHLADAFAEAAFFTGTE